MVPAVASMPTCRLRVKMCIRDSPRMASGHLQGRVLKMFVQMIRPRQVLEIGTYSGYSALCLAEGLEEGAMLHTFEINDEQEDFTRPWLSLIHI